MSYLFGKSLLVSTPNSLGVLPKENTVNHRLNENNNDHMMTNGSDKIQEIWNQHNFKPEKVEQVLNHNDIKVSSWMNESISQEQEVSNDDKSIEFQENETEISIVHMETIKEDQNVSPSHHARRPMNAFLIFCKKHRPIVRDRFPNLENRGVTKILGEWWSLLEEEDKTPFTNLANEYKDAFLSANPDFKWYKLPAPPLRTLTVRPPQISTKLPSQSSPSHASPQNLNEFNPGKLADESQLGSLTTLMNSEFSPAITKLTECCENRRAPSVGPIFELGENNNKIELCDTFHASPVNLIKAAALPPKPLKKRIFEKYSVSNTKEVSENILEIEHNENYYSLHLEHQKEQNSMTNQDIVDKVVDKMLIEAGDNFNKLDLERENTRKSGRQCKGKIYEKFMKEGKLLGNKKEPKLTQHKLCDVATSDKQANERKPEIQTPPNLENTIRRLAERTKIPFIKTEENEPLSLASKEHKEERCGSETSEPSTGSNFNLDLKIGNLPCLSYEAFVQKKRESKKKKLRKVGSENLRNGDRRVKKAEPLVGSKKRKNKHSITHLEKKQKTDIISDLEGLATLAEVAANTQKINEN